MTDLKSHVRRNDVQGIKKEITNALLLACDIGSCECALALIKAGANVNYADPNDIGRTALMLSCQKGHEKCALALINAKADLEKKDEEEMTALLFACENGHEQCLLALMNSGAAVDVTVDDGWTALIIACQNGHEQCARALLKAKADPNKAADNGFTALMSAVENGFEQCALALLEADADPNKAADNGFTALMLAAKNKEFSIINMLHNAGADMSQLEIQDLCINNDEDEENKKCLLDPVNLTCLDGNKGIQINENYGKKGAYCYQTGVLSNIKSIGNKKDPMDRSEIDIVNVTKLVKSLLEIDEDAPHHIYRKQ